MTDEQIERRLRRALLDEGAEFAHSIDAGAIRARLADGTARHLESRRGLWLVAAAAVVAVVAVGVILAVAPKSSNLPGQPSPGVPSGPAATPATMDVDPGWRLAYAHSGQVTKAAPEPVGVHFTLPADATRLAIKVRCSGPAPLVVTSGTFVHTASCADPAAVSRAVYRVTTDEASGDVHLAFTGTAPTSFEVVAETTASQLGDALSLDPTPPPAGSNGNEPRAPQLVIPADWVATSEPLSGGSGGISTLDMDTPMFKPGPVTMVLACIGSGSLDVAMVNIADPGAATPTIAPAAGQVVRCDGATGQVTVQLVRPSNGTENGIEVESESDNSNIDFLWSLELGQGRQ
jgi:hypothetical protein